MIARFCFRVWSFFITSSKLWGLLEQTGITVFVGPNGAGKSLVMVQAELATLAGREWECWDAEHKHQAGFKRHCDTCEVCSLDTYKPHGCGSAADLEDLRSRGVVCDSATEILTAASVGVRRVFSTVPLTVSRGVPHPLYEPLTDYRQLLHIEHADVLFDEVAGIADASASSTMPVQVVNWMHKLRKADVRLRVTTPAYARCALPIRQVAQVVVEMRAFFPGPANGKLWRPRRVVLATAYDAFAFDQFMANDGQRNKLKPVAKGLLWVPTAKATEVYNSWGAVLQLGHVNETGMCVACGGARSRPKCGCAEDHFDADHVLEVETTVTAAGSRVKRAVAVDHG